MKQNPPIQIRDLGLTAYEDALTLQRELNQALIDGQAPPTVLLVEHSPVITLTRRAGPNLLADQATLDRLGVATAQTDRGGDITYHGPGQLVVYPILKLGDFGLNLSSYMRLLERTVIDTIANWGIAGHNECGATGVWVQSPEDRGLRPEGQNHKTPVGAALKPQALSLKPRTAKICAMGVRIRKNTTLHGLALNVAPDLSHFDLIVPCGLEGRPVTSMQQLLGGDCPPIDVVKQTLSDRLVELLGHTQDAIQCASGT